MIQDIFPHHLDNAFYPDRTPGADSTVFSIDEGRVLVHSRNRTFPAYRETSGAKVLRLFGMDGRDVFLATEKGLLIPGYEYADPRRLRREGSLSRPDAFCLYTALHLAAWYASSVFCGRCGARTAPSEKERAQVCPVCGQVIYPRINPAVIVGVIDGDRLLQTRYAHRSFASYALVAGFTEIGETLEETVRREVMEEVGLKVKNIRYYRSQPWGTAGDILAGFFCETDGSSVIRLDQNELKCAVWHTREEIVLQDDDFSLTNEMMRVFKEGMQV